MYLYSSRAGSCAAFAVIIGTLALLAWPSSGALAQDRAATAVGAAPAEPAASSRRERRRAAQAGTPAAPQATAPAAVAATAPVAASAPAAAAERPAAEPTTICKNIKPLGTRMAKRVCGTPEQWAAVEKKTTDAASDDLRQVRGTGGVIATTPGPASTP